MPLWYALRELILTVRDITEDSVFGVTSYPRRRERRCWTSVLGALRILASACTGPVSRARSQILGRWRRVVDPVPGGPESMRAETIEFRPERRLVRLLWDGTNDQF